MRFIRNGSKTNIVCWALLLSAQFSLDSAAQTSHHPSGNGRSPHHSPAMIPVLVSAYQGGSDDEAKFYMNDGQSWWVDERANTNCQHTFLVKSGREYRLQAIPHKAIHPPDGAVSLGWQVWSTNSSVTITGTAPTAVWENPMKKEEYTITVPTVTAIQLKRGDEWETTPVAALKTVCKGATLTFRAMVKPESGCSVVWQNEDGQVIGSGAELSYTFPKSQRISAMCQDAPSTQRQTASVITIENSLSDPTAVITKEIPASTPLEDGVAGQVTQESLDMTPFSACLTDWGWQPMLTMLEGRYSIQYRLRVKEAGNPTEKNFCAQADDLFSNTPPYPDPEVEHWYMLAAIIAHEQVHVDDSKLALQEVAQTCEQYLESLGSLDTIGRTQIDALSEIDSEKAKRACFEKWQIKSGEKGEQSHECRTTRAMRVVLNPKFEAICQEASTTWPVSWGKCILCSKIGPPVIPTCTP